MVDFNYTLFYMPHITQSVSIVFFHSIFAFEVLYPPLWFIYFLIFILTATTYQVRCYCGNIFWAIARRVDSTSMCHRKGCQTVAGLAFGTTSKV